MFEYDEDDAPRVRPVEPETVTMEAFFEAVKALRRVQTLEGVKEDPYLRRALRMALCTVTPERIVCALDKAAENPDWWHVNRLHVFCPEMTQGEIGAFLNIKKTSVRHYINHVEIPADTYEALPPIPKY